MESRKIEVRYIKPAHEDPYWVESETTLGGVT
jgi:hypothetical protein